MKDSDPFTITVENVLISPLPPPTVDVENGLVAHWQFDEGSGTLLRDRENTSDGKIGGAAWTEGFRGNGLAFDGLDDTVSIPGNKFSNLRSGTITALVKPNAGGAVLSTAHSGLGDSSNRQFPLAVVDKGNGVFALSTTGVTASEKVQFVCETAATYTLGEWHAIAYATEDGSDAYQVYVDGEQQDVTCSRGQITNFFFADAMVDGDSLLLGAKSDIVARRATFFSGVLDEVRIYDRALSSAEIRAFGSIVRTPAPIDPGLTPTPNPVDPIGPSPMVSTLVSAEHLVYERSFRVPQGQQGSSRFSYGGTAPAYNPANNSLFMVGYPWNRRIAEISVPESQGQSTGMSMTASMLQNFAAPCDHHVADHFRVGDALVGGLIVDEERSRLMQSVYIFYDATFAAGTSHCDMSLDLGEAHAARGMYRLGAINPGYVAGYMARVPDEWREAMGAPYVTGNAGLSIITRTSLGPSLHGFNPAHFGNAVGSDSPIPINSFVYYPIERPTLGGYESTVVAGDPLRSYNQAATIKGVVIPEGSSTALFFGNQGIGAACYGSGEKCNDLRNPGQGTHVMGGDYRAAVWAYDLNDFVRVRRREMEKWEIVPYAVWNPTIPRATTIDQQVIKGVAYDRRGGRIFIVTLEDSPDPDHTVLYPMVHIFRLRQGTVSGN